YLPDINNASFAMTRQQFRNCQRNGVRDILALFIGYDGIVVFSDTDSLLNDFSRDGFYRAIAAEVAESGSFTANTIRLWSDIDSALPQEPVHVLGPPPTSGTRAFIEQEILKPVCERRLGRPLSSL